MSDSLGDAFIRFRPAKSEAPEEQSPLQPSQPSPSLQPAQTLLTLTESTHRLPEAAVMQETVIEEPDEFDAFMNEIQSTVQAQESDANVTTTNKSTLR